MPDGHASPKANDVRFQYEVIRNLAESVRQTATSVERLTSTIGQVQQTQVGMLERLAKIEANRVNEDLADLKVRGEALTARVDKLESAHDYEAGMRGARKAVIFYWPVFAALSAFMLLLLIATGIVTVPETQKAPVATQAPPKGMS
ncbi:hypothetical protein [Flavisphingomonas formosensis]|uniref:hypothetical protein n=1 Tax=Flavisphingomonas formosensis TaxID=861534 RepID=UPI0012F9A6C6|nr:hypothetical protein [Sphingomonas formosensis]